MSEDVSVPLQDGRTAGRLLRDARAAAGVEAAALAAQLKVPLAKIEALEADRYDALPGVAFTRGLALAMTRALKVDAQPVLDRLPQATSQVLEEVSRGLNAPFRARPGVLAGVDLSMLRNPVVWGPLAFLVAGVALWLMPLAPIGRGPGELLQAVPPTSSAGVAPGAGTAAGSVANAPAPGGLPGLTSAGEPAAATAGGVASPGAAPGPSVEIVHSAPAMMTASAGDEILADGSRPLLLRAGAASWVEVRDAKGSLLLSRTLQPGETISLGGALPLRAVVGNAADTKAIVHGRDFNIAQYTSNNVARFEVR